jgi:DNA-binding transcriptional regulator YiaG
MPKKPKKQSSLGTDSVDIDVMSTPVQVESIDADPQALTKPARRGRHQAIKRPVTSPDLFSNSSITRMASNRVIWEGANILSQGENLEWMQAEDGSYYESPVAKGKGFVSFWVSNDFFAKHPAVLEGEAALALIEQFDIRAACMHLIYAAHATQLDRPWEQSFVLSDTQLEKYLGLDQNRNFKNKQQKLQLMLELAKQPCHLLVYVSYPGQGKVRAFNISRTWLWEIAEPILHFQEGIEDETGQSIGDRQLVGFTLRIRCGYWAQYFLNQERLQDKTGYYEYGILSKGVLTDIMSTWHHQEGAARLMTWLLFKTRVNRNHPLGVENLMKVAFGEALVEAAKVGFRDREKLVRRWLTSLKVMHEKGWILTPDAETYPLQYWFDTESTSLAQIPDDPEQAASFWATDAAKAQGQRITDLTKRTRQAFEQLLGSKLWVRPPSAIAQKLDEIEEYRKPQRSKLFNSSGQQEGLTADTVSGKVKVSHRSKKEEPTAGATEEITGAWIKQQRTARKLSQRGLSDLTGISQKLISMIENGERRVSPTNRDILRQILNQQ